MIKDDIDTKNQLLFLTIRSRNKTYFEGTAISVTSHNDTGVFDVLPFHANFISVIRDYILVNVPNEEQKKFEIKGGVLRVLDDRVNVYLTV